MQKSGHHIQKYFTKIYTGPVELTWWDTCNELLNEGIFFKWITNSKFKCHICSDILLCEKEGREREREREMRNKGRGSQQLLGNQSPEEQRGWSSTPPSECVCVSEDWLDWREECGCRWRCWWGWQTVGVCLERQIGVETHCECASRSLTHRHTQSWDP